MRKVSRRRIVGSCARAQIMTQYRKRVKSTRAAGSTAALRTIAIQPITMSMSEALSGMDENGEKKRARHAKFIGSLLEKTQKIQREMRGRRYKVRHALQHCFGTCIRGYPSYTPFLHTCRKFK